MDKWTDPLPSFASPEVQLHDVLTPACDVWSLGCLIFSLFQPNLDMWKPTIWARDTLLSFTLAYGKLPEHWWAMWKDRESFFFLKTES
jgi:serine/threonine protein kinase